MRHKSVRADVTSYEELSECDVKSDRKINETRHA